MSGRSRSPSASAAPASTISKISASKFRTTPLPLSPASAAPANLRSRSTPFTRRASAATSNRFPLTPANFSSAWKNRMWTKFRGSRRRWRFGRKIQRGTRVRTWRRQRKFTIICGSFLRAADKRFASSVAHRFERIARTKSLRGFCRLRRAGGFTSCTSFESPRPRRQFRNEAPRKPPALRDLQKRGFNRLYQVGRIHEFSSPETLLDVDFSKPVYVLVDRLAVNPES